MTKCMEAAAENHIEFVVLDRSNPLGGLRVEGPLVEPQWISFVGQIPVPYVRGMTCSKLARMINGKGWVGRCDLKVAPMRGWARNVTWNDTALRWIPTSPNIPRWNSPLCYVATALIGELHGPEPLGGISFSEYRSGAVGGSGLHIDPAAASNLTAVNIYALAEMNRQLRTNLITPSSGEKREMFFKCCGSSSIASQFARDIGPAGIVASWTEDVTRFKGERSQYLLY